MARPCTQKRAWPQHVVLGTVRAPKTASAQGWERRAGRWRPSQNGARECQPVPCRSRPPSLVQARRLWELIVVDNGGTDGTPTSLAGVQDASSVPITFVTNRGF